jgi:hypothetical protein
MESALCCVDTTSLGGMKWRPFSGVGQATFSLLGVKPEGKKQEEEGEKQEVEEVEEGANLI